MTALKKIDEPARLVSRAMLELADKDITMDWEGGTIGAIVPALMGYGEAGRASPWPFFMRCSICLADPILVKENRNRLRKSGC